MPVERAICFACSDFFFFIFKNDFLEPKYLRIYWTDFFHQIIGICLQIIDSIFFSDYLRDIAMATNFVVKSSNDRYLLH